MNWPVVVGVGSFHGDDQAGWLVLSELRSLGFPTERTHSLRHPAQLLDVVAPSDKLMICDACLSRGEIGKIGRFHWPTNELTYQRSRGTHDYPLQDILKLRQALGGNPADVDIWVIEGANWSPNGSPSSEVLQAARTVALQIWQMVSA